MSTKNVTKKTNQKNSPSIQKLNRKIKSLEKKLANAEAELSLYRNNKITSDWGLSESRVSEAIVQHSPVAIVSIDPQENVVAWNPEAENLFGYTAAEALGRNVDSLVAKDESIHTEAVGFSKQQQTGRDDFHAITKRTRKDGTLVDVELSGVPISIDGRHIGMIAIYHDITELQRAKREADQARDAVQKEKEFSEAIVQHSPVAIVSIDPQENVVAWNPEAENLFGYTAAEALGRNVDSLVANDESIHTEAVGFSKQQQTGRDDFHAITKRTHKDGTLVDVELSGVPISIDGQHIGMIAIYHDITELQRARREAENRAAELEAISQVSQALIAESTLESTIQLIGSQMRELFGADIVYLALHDQETNLIHFPYQYGESFEAIRFGEGLTSKIIQTGEPLLINHNVEEKTQKIGATHVGKQVLSYLGVPIQTSQGTIGVISVQSITQEGFFNHDSLRLLTTIAANAAAALQNAQLFSEALENLRQVEILTNAANAIENSAYEPTMVESVAARNDALGELARVFRNMANEVRLREQRLKRQLAQLQLDIQEKQQAKAETVALYTSMDRRQALAKNLSLREHVHGTALFADVSGFTALTELLTKELGMDRGAEEMIRHLNRVFTVLTDEVHRFSGAIINFSGDAITCWFDDLDLKGNPVQDSSTERAAACALAMQKGMESFSAIATPNGKTMGLTIKVALATGPARRMVVGDRTAHQIDVLAGSTLLALAKAEQKAESSEIILATANLPNLEEKFKVEKWRNKKQFAVVSGLSREITPSPWATLADDAIPESKTKPWMHPTVFEKVRAGQSDMLSELRPATALFLKFDGLDYDKDTQAADKLKSFIQWVEETIAPHNGSIIQFTIGDKGSYVYIVFGAPIAHKDDAVQAVFTALELASPPDALAYITELYIGIASGQMRVGAYGGSSHRTYGAIGDSTNLAARLMTLASKTSMQLPKNQRAHILCNASVYKAARAQVEFESLAPVVVKGKTEPIAIYRPLLKLRMDEKASPVNVELSQRIDRLSPAEQLTLKVASVIGQTFTLETLIAIYPEAQDREVLIQHLKILNESDLIVMGSADHASYYFNDPQIQEAAYNLMLFAQRRQLHRAVAELLEQNISEAPLYAEVARHWQAADDIPKAIHYLEEGGEHARKMGDFEEAKRFFKASLDLTT